MKNNQLNYSLFFVTAFFLTLLVPVHQLNLTPNTINENFYGRTELTQVATDFRVWLGDRVYNNAVIGKSGWLIYTGELSADDYQNTIPFSETDLEKFAKNLDALSNEYAQEDITLLVVIAPNKNTIYSEYVPDELVVLNDESRLDQLLHYMNEHGKTQILDLRPVLFEAKQENVVYHKTDTHWNSYGAFVAYQEIVSSLSADYSDIQALSFSDFSQKEVYDRQLDLTKIMGTSFIKEDVLNLIPKNESNVRIRYVDLQGVPRKLVFSSNPENNIFPSAVVFHDSFLDAVSPFLREHFSRAVFIPHYTPVSDLHWVDEQNPDIVIIEFTERYIDSLVDMINAH